MHRDRPLQNSMFLQDSNGNRRGSIEFSNPNYNLMNKNSQHNFSQPINEGQYNMHYTMNTGGNTPTRKYYIEQQKDAGSNRNMQQRFNQFYERLQQMGRMVDKHQFQLGSINLQNKKEELLRQVTQQIKQNIPVITGNNDVYEHIFNLKLEIKSLREEVSKFSGKLNIESLESNSKNLNTSENGQKKSLKDDMPSKQQLLNEIKSQILRPRDQFFKNLIGNIQTEMGFLKKNLQNYMMELKVSPISSSSCIILKYQQLFKARGKGDMDMVINQQTYYIDNQGFLLDCHSRYIVDQKGKKVRLDQKHIAMLKNQKILQ